MQNQPKVGTKAPYLSRQDAFRPVADHKDGFRAIEGLAQAPCDMSSGDQMPPKQGAAVYRVAHSIVEHYEILAQLHQQLFHGLHRAAKPSDALEHEAAQYGQEDIPPRPHCRGRC